MAKAPKEKSTYAALDRQARHFEKQAREAKTPAARAQAGRMLGAKLKRKAAVKKSDSLGAVLLWVGPRLGGGRGGGPES